MSQTTNMTQGNPLRLLTSFALPLFFGCIFQQLYNVVDSAVVGRLIGVNAFAAVGAAGFLSWMVISITLGFTQGFGILFAQRFGAEDVSGLRRGIAMSIGLTLALGALLTAAGLLFARSILTLMRTPQGILEDAQLYLQWIFIGTLPMAAYNTAASLLRSLGNSRSPLIAVIISSLVNVVLDFLLVGGLHMGVDGVAIATVVAQCCSFFYCLWILLRIKTIRLCKKDFHLDKATSFELLRLGGPLAFRNGIISLGGLIVQSVVNGFGTLFVAGTTAAKKFYGFMEIVGCALDGAFATFVAQNYGAKNMARIREGMTCARRISLISSVSIAALVILFREQLIRMLVSGTPEELRQVTEIGSQNLVVMALCLPPLYLLFIYRSGLQGMGCTLIPMLSGFTELGLRIVSVLVLPLFIGTWGIYLADGLGWIGASLLLGISYSYSFRKRQREFPPASHSENSELDKTEEIK